MRNLFSRSAISAALLCLSVTSVASRQAAGQKVVGKIAVQGFPGQGAYDSALQETFVPTGTNSVGTSAVSVIGKKNTVDRTITLPTNWGTVSVALNPVTKRLYVGAENGGLYIVDPKSGMLLAEVNVNAVSVVVNQVTNKVYVSDFDNSVYVIDGATNNILKTIKVDAIENLAINPVTNHVYAAQDVFPGQVTVIDGKSDTIMKTVQAGGNLTFAVAVDALTNTFYSADELGTVSVYDGKTNTRKATISLPGSQPVGILVDASDKRLFVSSASDNKVYILDVTTNKVVKTVTVGMTPEYMTLDLKHNLVYVGNTGQTDANGNPVFSLSVVKEK